MNNKQSNVHIGCGIFACIENNTAHMIGFVNKNLTGIYPSLHMGNLIKELCKLLGGGGGGRQDYAKGGGKKIELLDEVLEIAKQAIKYIIIYDETNNALQYLENNSAYINKDEFISIKQDLQYIKDEIESICNNK